MSVPYPAAPVGLPDDFTRPDAAFRRRVVVVFAGILTFLAIYVGLLGFIVAFVWDTVQRVREPTVGDDPVAQIILSIPLSLLAVFLLKGLFVRGKPHEGVRVEITEVDEPQLFAFIHRIADEAGAPRPHRVFLTPDVNASVSYESSVLGLFLPTPKNLTIGLGLVNNLSLDELKAVLAHEFGHFSQSSMRLGTWVYQANRVIAHMVTVRDWWDRFIDGWSRWDLRISFPAWLLKLLTWVLREGMATIYELVNRAYLALSREMEFHADRVSVSLTGSDSLVHALARLPFAEESMTDATRVLESQKQLGRATDDLFVHQSASMAYARKVSGDAMLGATPARPMPPSPGFRVFGERRVRPPAMWASHPADALREARAKALYVPSELVADPGWVVFGQAERWRRELTAQWNAKVIEVPSGTAVVPAAQLQERIDGLRCASVHDPAYRGLYEVGPVLLWADTAQEIVDAPRPDDVGAALDACYDDEAAALAQQVRDRRRELVELVAVAAGEAEADDGMVVVDGQTELATEASSLVPQGLAAWTSVSARWTDHLRAVRVAHLAAAAQLGDDEVTALGHLLGFVHFAEHTSTRMGVAFGAVANVLGSVSGRSQLDADAFRVVHGTLAMARHELARAVELSAGVVPPDGVLPDAQVSWSAWLLDAPVVAPELGETIDGVWIGILTDQMRRVGTTLEEATERSLGALLDREAEVAARWGALQAGEAPGPCAPVPAPPEGYGTVTELELDPVTGRWPVVDPGARDKPSFWDRYGRRLSAGALALLFVALAGWWWMGRGVEVYVVNGFDRPLVVQVDGQQRELAPHEGVSFGVFGGGQHHLEATLDDGRVVDVTDQDVGVLHHRRVVWNPGRRALLVQAPIIYGTAPHAPEPRLLPTESWTAINAHHPFEEPPTSISGKGAGDYRLVLSDSGAGASVAGAVAYLIEQSRQDEAFVLARSWLTFDTHPAGSVDGLGAVLSASPEVFADLLDEVHAGGPVDVEVERAWLDTHPASLAQRRQELAARAAAHPDDAVAWYLVARYAPEGSDEAVQAATRATTLDPDLAYAWLLRIHQMAQRGDLEEADAVARNVGDQGGEVAFRALLVRLQMAARAGHGAADDVTLAILGEAEAQGVAPEALTLLRRALSARRADLTYEEATADLDPDADWMSAWYAAQAAGRVDAMGGLVATSPEQTRPGFSMVVAIAADDGPTIDRLAHALGDDVEAWKNLPLAAELSLAVAERTGMARALDQVDTYEIVRETLGPVFGAARDPSALAAAVDGLPAWHQPMGAAVAAVLLGGPEAAPLRERAKAGLDVMRAPGW